MTASADHGGYDVLIMTDGSCGSNNDLGAWAAVITDGLVTEVVHGTEYPSTNIRAELLAIIRGIVWVAKTRTEIKDSPYSDRQPLRVLVLTDSEYAVKTYMQGLDVKSNKDLWAALRLRPLGMTVTLRWVERNTTPGNAYCDMLAGELRDQNIEMLNRLVSGYLKQPGLTFRSVHATCPAVRETYTTYAHKPPVHGDTENAHAHIPPG